MSTTEQTIGGWHAVASALDGDAPPFEIWMLKTRRDQRSEALRKRADQQRVRVHLVDRQQLDLLLPGIRHQGVVARVPAASLGGEELLEQAPPADGLLLVLDGVTDPHNLGACLRTAEACGVQAIITPKDRSVGLTPVVRKVAAGSADRIPVIAVTNLVRTLEGLKQRGYWISGLSGEGDRSLYDLDLKGPTVLVMGAEGAGMRRLTRDCCDHLARIPMAGQIESLNVSVAAAVCLYEAVRQRR